MQQPLLTHPGAPRAKRALGWLSGVVALGVVVLATSAGALAWGPERPTYTLPLGMSATLCVLKKLVRRPAPTATTPR